MLGVAAAAAASGAGVWRWSSNRDPTAALWGMRFPRPDGSALVMAAFRGKPLLLNFWATWCPPCVKELPLIDRFHSEQRLRGWQVVGLAVDQQAPVSSFLQRQPVGFHVGLAGLEGVELSRTLGNAGGGLPFTVVFDAKGQVMQHKLGTLQQEDLDRWAHLPV